MDQTYLKGIKVAGIVVGAVLGVWLLLIIVSLLFTTTPWEALKVLAVPLTVGAAVPLLSWLQKKRELDVENQRAQDEALQAYLDKMSDLLVIHGLGKPRSEDQENPVRTVAWARTKTVLRRLDGKRKGAVLRFLREANLIEKGHLRIRRLSGADLREADLEGSVLEDTALEGVDLRGAVLREAVLRGCVLRTADLTGADLKEADLTNTDLTDTYVTEGQLEAAKSLEGATMPDAQTLKGSDNPDGPTFNEWLKSRGSGEDGENGGPS